MQLTPEQLRKSAVAALDAVGERGCNRCSTDLRFALGIGTVETMITAAFAALAQAQVDVPGDLVERMLDAFEAHAGDGGVVSMTAALRVALEDPRVLGEPDDSETGTTASRCADRQEIGE